jgi:transposase
LSITTRLFGGKTGSNCSFSHSSKILLRLPPYHCEFNPIELIWGDLKGYIGRENSTFKLNDVKNLIQEGFSQIDKLKWLNACNHVKNNIELK